MTPLKQQISLIPFSIEHWCSPYKRRRFENQSDQTFYILLIKDVLSVNLHSVTWPTAYYYYYYFFKPSKNEGRKKIEKVKKNGEANVPSKRGAY